MAVPMLMLDEPVVSAATSLVGQVVTDVNSVVTQVLGNGDTKTYSPTTTTRYDATTTIYATQTVTTQRNSAAHSAGALSTLAGKVPLLVLSAYFLAA